MDLLKTLDAIRDDIGRINQEITDVESMRVPPTEAAKRVEQGVNALRFAYQDNARQAILRLAEPAATPTAAVEKFLTQTGRVVQLTKVPIQDAEISLAGLIAWLHGDELVAKLTEAIDHAGYPAGLPINERPARLAELRRELRKLEEQEEKLVEACEEAGIEAFRRADIDPEIVLGYRPDDDGTVGTLAAAERKVWVGARGAATAAQPATPAPASLGRIA